MPSPHLSHLATGQHGANLQRPALQCHVHHHLSCAGAANPTVQLGTLGWTWRATWEVAFVVSATGVV